MLGAQYGLMFETYFVIAFLGRKAQQFRNKILYFSPSIKDMNLLVRLVRYLYFQCHFVSEVAGDFR